jgi:hypothetical protein
MGGKGIYHFVFDKINHTAPKNWAVGKDCSMVNLRKTKKQHFSLKKIM